MTRLIAHIVRSGRAICGRAGTPNTWGADERMVVWNDVPQTPRRLICAACLPVYEHDVYDSHRRQQRRVTQRRVTQKSAGGSGPKIT